MLFVFALQILITFALHIIAFFFINSPLLCLCRLILIKSLPFYAILNIFFFFGLPFYYITNQPHTCHKHTLLNYYKKKFGKENFLRLQHQVVARITKIKYKNQN